MTEELFETLLYEEEGTTIDFKKKQYVFVHASDDDKSELVKDILGFANAWRRAKAYILIGVEEVRGDKSNVLGIPASDQLDDHALQQCINSLTNTPVHFQYRAFSYQGKQVGIFVLDEEQQRPVYLKRNYGKLEKDKVYMRRGSSTNPTKPASPEEIARMGATRPKENAELLIAFAEVDRDDVIGAHIPLQFEICTVPATKDLPLLRNTNSYDVLMSSLVTRNPNFYRDLAKYEFMTRLCRAVRLTVMNIGNVPANNVRVELTIPADIGLILTLELPTRPQKKETVGLPRIPPIRTANRRDPGEVDIDTNKDRYRVEVDCKDLQPGRQVWSDKMYIGCGHNGDYPLHGQILSDNLPQPQQFTLTITAQVEHTTLTKEEICSE